MASRLSLIGASTNLNSSRSRLSISQRLGISWMDYWRKCSLKRQVNLSFPFSEFNRSDPFQRWRQDSTEFTMKWFTAVPKSSNERAIPVPYTSWAWTLLRLPKFCGIFTIFGISVNCQFHELLWIGQEIFLPLACVLGSDNVKSVAKQNLIESKATKISQRNLWDLKRYQILVQRNEINANHWWAPMKFRLSIDFIGSCSTIRDGFEHGRLARFDGKLVWNTV